MEEKERRRWGKAKPSENKRERRKSYPASSLVGLSRHFSSALSFLLPDLNGSAVVSFHNLIVLIKFHRGIALRRAHWPGGHNANCDVYGMNREWNSKWDDRGRERGCRWRSTGYSGEISEENLALAFLPHFKHPSQYL